MIDLKENPTFLNSFLEYLTGILNKSVNTVKEYNYDLSHFLKFISHHFGLSSEENHALPADSSTERFRFKHR